MCKIGEDGYPILSADIDINAIMKQCGYSNPISSESPENAPQSGSLNNHKTEQ